MFVITGGGLGIGQALAHALAAKKQTVLILGRNKARLEKTASFSPYIQTLTTDITTSQGRDAVRAALKNETSIQALIHNASVVEPMPLRKLTEATWDNVIDTNLKVSFLLTQKLYDKLAGGRMLQLISAVAYNPLRALAPYSVSKAGVLALTRCWQTECPEIASTSVMPGVVDTETLATVRNSSHLYPEERHWLQQLKNNNQLVSSETVAAFLTWLLLDISKEQYISKEWDIYDTSHHTEWLSAPHRVPILKK